MSLSGSKRLTMDLSVSTSKDRLRSTMFSRALGPHIEMTEARTEGEPSVLNWMILRLC